MYYGLLDVVIGCLDNRVFNWINGRVPPGEDVAGRVIGNIEWLFTALSVQQCNGIDLAEQAAQPRVLRFSELVAHLQQ